MTIKLGPVDVAQFLVGTLGVLIVLGLWVALLMWALPAFFRDLRRCEYCDRPTHPLPCRVPRVEAEKAP